MIKAVVKFWGEGLDDFGMPTPYHSYFVVSSPWLTADGGVASVVPLSTGAPLSKAHFSVTAGGERAAFEVAVEALASEPSNVGLKRQSHED